MQPRYLTALYTSLTMIAFASNSILNWLALGQGSIDAASYTTIRLTAGAITLWLISFLQRNNTGLKVRGNWISAAMLFIYAITFSFAYLSLTAGTGALILFGTVQVTMILVALCSGERPQLLEWLGVLLALGGLVYLVIPRLKSPSLFGSTLMMMAGIAWGIYSLRGRGTKSPLEATAGNFIRAVPFIIAVRLVTLNNLNYLNPGFYWLSFREQSLQE